VVLTVGVLLHCEGGSRDLRRHLRNDDVSGVCEDGPQDLERGLVCW
jgi:hypothetical protein